MSTRAHGAYGKLRTTTLSIFAPLPCVMNTVIHCVYVWTSRNQQSVKLPKEKLHKRDGAKKYYISFMTEV